MKNLFLTTTITLFTTTSLFADTLEYRYKEVSPGVYKCLNASQKEGHNPGFLGECGQVSGQKFGPLTAHLWMPGIQSVNTEYQSPDFSDSFLADCDFSKAKMNGADLHDSLIRRCLFSNANLQRVSMHNNLIEQNNFSGANLNAGDFGNSSLKLDRFDSATLTGAEFQMSLLDQIDFSMSDLTQADFSHTRITSTDFSNADLRGATFFDTYVDDSDLWHGAQYDETTQLPFTEDIAKEKGMVTWSQSWPVKDSKH
jgi:hypothetical protein